jgi:hypothetical protein
MNTHYILRKANGDLLTIEVHGKKSIAVWDSEVGVRRSQRANPDLIVYVPAPLDRRLIERNHPGLSASFFLVHNQGTDLRTGREISPEELFGGPTLAQAA